MVGRLLFLAALAWPALSHAEPGAWVAKATCKSELSEKYPLPATLPRAALLRDTPAGPLPRSDEKAEVACGVFARPWKSQRTPSFVVFVETALFFHNEAGERENADRWLRMAVYVQGPDGQFRPAARSVAPFALHGRRLVDVDLAPYKLTDGEFAFGVRTAGDVECDGNCTTDNGDLDVFRVVGTGIHPILSTVLWSTTHTIGPANDDGTRDHDYTGDEEPARISVLKTRTKGFFDWKKTKGKASAILRWNGQKYELSGDDPVPVGP